MNINDETLSAFLDGELTPAEMEQVRTRLAEDPALADRLAELSAVDKLVSERAHAIDGRPLPSGIQQMLAEDEAEPKSAEVIAFPLWRRARQALNAQTGMAAAVALALGFGLAQVTENFGNPQADTFQPIAQRLETLPSGTSEALPDGREITPRLTFVNRDGQHCRQYRVTGEGERSENIACRTRQADTDWEQLASIRQRAAESGSYQTASGGSLLDSALDQMMAGGIIEPEQEKQLIERDWQPSP
ncbi:anti-sigma factor family protein [Marinimicrobium sp. C2-29]|uniref:anti-sigma factor family protein n=1 Tax=Marinimicrobium sp. C2-29 TaxID=3139825 RepID=UPI00313A36EF